MKILKRAFIRNGPGQVVLVPEDEEDLWALFNMILPGDMIKTRVHRKVKLTSKTGSVVNQKKVLFLTLKVLKIDYESDDTVELHFTAVNVTENKYIQKGQHQNFKISEFDQLTIIKDVWDKYHIKVLQESGKVE